MVKFERRVFWRRIMQVWSMCIVTLIVCWLIDTPAINAAHATIATAAIGVFGTVLAYIERRQQAEDND